VTLRRLTVLTTIVHHSAPVGDLVGALRASRWVRTPTGAFRPAKEIASLDLVSDGRVIFGVGIGWSREEMRNHGTDPRTRGSLMNERLAAIKEIWTKDEAEFHGTYVDFDPVFCWPKPVQRPHSPSTSAATARRRWPGWRRTATAGCRTRWATRAGSAPS